MTIASRIRSYLTREHVTYDEVIHAPAMSATTAAEAAHVSENSLAKGVVLRTKDRFMLAVVPASHHVRLGALRKYLGEEVGLATEDEIHLLFGDCDLGAIPPIGDAYGVETIIDDALMDANHVYLEGGDHRTLIHLGAEEWQRLTKKMPHAVFSG